VGARFVFIGQPQGMPGWGALFTWKRNAELTLVTYERALAARG